MVNLALTKPWMIYLFKKKIMPKYCQTIKGYLVFSLIRYYSSTKGAPMTQCHLFFLTTNSVTQIQNTTRHIAWQIISAPKKDFFKKIKKINHQLWNSGLILMFKKQFGQKMIPVFLLCNSPLCQDNREIKK